MESILLEKKQIRRLIADKRKQQSQLILEQTSDIIFESLEQTDMFCNAKTIFIYHSIEGEVFTKHFLEKWKMRKDLYLPIVEDDNIFFRKYTSEENLILSKFGILEPMGKNVDTEQLKIDLVIVPGVAFDVNCNRMGYGKGFYDKFLSRIKTIKLGLCFSFQLLNRIPTNQQDIAMDYVITEKGIVSKVNKE